MKSPVLEVAILKENQLKRVSDFIGSEVGIQLPSSKHKLVEGRLQKRLTILGFNDFESYLNHTLETSAGELEKLHLIDVITTNKTHFYRESNHFDYLEKSAIAELELMKLNDARQELNFWSAGCSSGEEAYTLSIVLNEIASQKRNFLFNIFATDISQRCLEKAKRGIYTENQIDIVPISLRKKYFLRSKNKKEALVQMGTELKREIKFMKLNLMDKRFSLETKMDVIFCRNVMIYFNDQLREELVSKFENQLVDGGYLFVGHSESLNGKKTILKQVSPMVYRKV
ncbi:MAG: chemotaxis protein CheR [Gammaproteobacteria bacterium]|nr:chemotaxis protein CheR [Gammaproteobacteria bacterium]